MLLDERSPHEPDEPDLGPDVPDEPDEPDLGPDVPDVAPPDEGFFGPEDTPADVLKAFWSLVVLFNVGLFAVSLGIMLIGFRGAWAFGGAFLAVGLLALARGVYRYSTLDLDEE